jgi:hypothetical protein
MFIVQNIYTKEFVADVSRTNSQIEKTVNERQSRIFNNRWRPFWKFFNTDYEIIEIELNKDDW